MSETIDSTASGVGGAGASSTIPPTATSTKAEPAASGTTPLTSSVLPKAIIKNVDMSEEMQQASVDIASEAMTKYTIEKDIAAYVKKAMDTKFGPTWHAVVGKNYGSYVTHETKHFIYFYLGQIAFLLWRA